MKRLLVLIVVLAGGIAAASLSVPSNAATVNGVAISQARLNSDIAAIANGTGGLYACFLNAEEVVATNGQEALPPLGGVGQNSKSGRYDTVTTAFVSNYLDTEIGHALVQQLAAAHHVVVTPADLTAARTGLEGQITSVLQEVSGSQYACGSSTAPLTGAQVLATLPASFVSDEVRFDATISVLEETLSGVGASVTDLQTYYNEHQNLFETACFTVAEYSTQSDAQAAIATVNSGTPFATVASQVPGGGPQGCDILYGISSELPSGNLDTLPDNVLSAPILAGSSYLVVEITSRTPTPFQTAKAEVQSAVRTLGAAKSQADIASTERKAAVSVDPRYGTWVGSAAHVLVPDAPSAVDVLNPFVDSPSTSTSTSTSTSGSGTASPSTSQSG